MKTKTKRIWTDEQRVAAAERMRRNNPAKARWNAEKTAEQSTALAIEGQQIQESNIATAGQDMGSITTVEASPRSPEVQAVIDSMPENRKAKLAQVQARTLANLSQTQEGREALERLEQRHKGQAPTESSALSVEQSEKVLEKPQDVPPAPIIPKLTEVSYRVPFRLTGSQSGMMISELGPCVCGEAKLKWHPVCLKVKAYV